MNNMPNDEKKYFAVFKKYSLGIGLFALTVTLMLFFKNNRQNITTIIEEGKGSLIDFYTKNLKPLFFKTDITNEDVFNFALYQNLPLNKKEDKILQINDESSGYDIFQIQPVAYNDNTKNYEEFIRYLDLNNKQKSDVDSILEFYKGELYSSILVNDENTIAVNPRIINLQKAIMADLVAFAQKVSSKRSKDLLPINYSFESNPEVEDMINIAKTEDKNDFIFFTPDTVFMQKCEFDKDKVKKELALAKEDIRLARDRLNDLKIKVNIDKNGFEIAIDSIIQNNLHFMIDSTGFTVACQKIEKHDFKKFVNLENNLHAVKEMLKSFTVRTTRDGRKEKSKSNDLKFNLDDDEIKFEINVNLDSLIESSLKFIDAIDFEKYDKMSVDIDSLLKELELIKRDSLIKINVRESRTRMK